MSSDSVVLNFNESLVRESDIELLKGPKWLNDTLISFYFDYLENVQFKSNTSFLFISPEVTQCIKMSPTNELSVFLDPLQAPKKGYIFFALNDNQNIYSSGGTHWSLLVFSKPEMTLYHFDSFKGTNNIQAKELGSKILHYLNISTQGHFLEHETLQQANGYDCGIHLICNVDMLTEYITRNYKITGCGPVDHTKIESKRNNLLKLIYSLKEK